MFIFRDLDNPETYITIAWFPEFENCTNVVLNNDYNSNMIYGVCEKQNGTKQDLIFFKGNPNIWYYENDLINKTLSYEESLLNPQIYVKGNVIYIVAETESQGLILFKSANTGVSWISYPITSSNIESKYPMITGNDTDIFCTFIDSRNISITSSNDGISWDEALQLNNVNESVYENYRQADFPGENHVVWTDERDGNKDIYMILKGLPQVDLMILPESVNISTEGYPFIPTKNFIHFTVKNIGNAYVEDLKVNVTYNCIGKEPQNTDYPGYIYYLDGNGAEKSFDRPLFRISANNFILDER